MRELSHFAATSQGAAWQPNADVFNRSEKLDAAAVLDRYWDGRLPVDPIRIANALGIKVQADSSGQMTESGVIEMVNGAPAITYNLADSEVRRRFTIAHEIGHFVLGHLDGAQKMYRDPSDNFSSSAKAPEERLANHFAAQFLMPAKTLRYAVEAKAMTSVERLARAFNVSQVAMGYRLKNLGLIDG